MIARCDEEGTAGVCASPSRRGGRISPCAPHGPLWPNHLLL